MSPNDSAFPPDDCDVPVRGKPGLASVVRVDAGDAGRAPIPLEPPGANRSDRIASLILRVDAVRIGLAGEQHKRRALVPPPVPPAQTKVRPRLLADMERSHPPVKRPDPPRFTRWPEVLLSVVAAVGLWFLASTYGEDLDDLGTAATLLLAMLLPFVLAAFICGGAALWRIFREP
ncbi:MAG TPA: hypothetical protein VML19_29915 [Verrucomicrobiae bacterium]|nr:hypothetical protein [Verrucomicrobiae bacterium]